MITRFTLVVTFCLAIAPAIAQETDQYSFEAKIQEVAPILCEDDTSMCDQLQVTASTGPLEGRELTIIHDPSDDLSNQKITFSPGMSIIVQAQEMNGEQIFFVSDIIRRTPLLWLVVLFVAAVFMFGGLGAMRSFLGMAVSIVILLFLIIPAILAGYSPLAVTFIGSLFIMIVTFLLCHGWNKKTAAAFLGTGGSLIVTIILAIGFSVYAHLTGTADEEMLFLLSDFPSLDTRGILLAGIIIGTLGVLDDITISQASAVFELRKANQKLTAAQLYKSAYRIGSDHIAAAVNTLVLAYAGTALPLLLLLVGVSAGESWWTFLNREMIAQEIIRTLIGSIGLLAAVPLTTWIASVFAINTPQEEL